MNKKLFKGTFNINGQNEIMYTTTINKDKAFYNFINKMAKKYNLAKYHYLNIFNGSKDNFRIEEIKDERSRKDTKN